MTNYHTDIITTFLSLILPASNNKVPTKCPRIWQLGYKESQIKHGSYSQATCASKNISVGTQTTRKPLLWLPPHENGSNGLYRCASTCQGHAQSLTSLGQNGSNRGPVQYSETKKNTLTLACVHIIHPSRCQHRSYDAFCQKSAPPPPPGNSKMTCNG